MKRLSLFFTAPRRVAVETAPIPAPAHRQVLVKTWLSAISPGTETLIYRGQFPPDMALDENIESLAGDFRYPFKYGYSLVGQVQAVGAEVDPAWQGRRVFAFHPHESHFVAAPDTLIPLPTNITFEDAVFLPNLETAVNLVMDGRPMLGERVLVWGQGVVGLLTTALLARFPLEKLVTVDRLTARRELSQKLGAHLSLAPEDETLVQIFGPTGPDLSYELSGSPAALNQAIEQAGFAGRIVVGSWYGRKQATLNLGGRFHRARLRLISSQVSTIDPTLSGRWDKARRFKVVWQMLRLLKPSRLITHRIPFAEAAAAYQLYDEQPDDVIQTVLTYQSST